MEQESTRTPWASQTTRTLRRATGSSPTTLPFLPTINWRVARAVFQRDVRAYFLNPTGYVFITLFIFLSAVAAFWREEFFSANLANLDQLNDYFPYLLLFFVPALTMGVWAEERRQGTDELLLTLPATGLEITLGKYAAALGVYTVAVALSLSHSFVLAWLGDPDWGLLFSNYLGYWFVGAALVSIAMVASLITRNVTVAFVLGAVFCGVLIFVDSSTWALSYAWQKQIAALGVNAHFNDFAHGVISVESVFYFISVALIGLYGNVTLLEKGHWPRGVEWGGMRAHHLARIIALIVAMVSVNVIIARAGMRLDATAEGLHSLSGSTEVILDSIDESRPVFIQAYISDVVPQQFIETRANLLAFLSEIDAVAGAKVEVAIYPTEAYSDEAREARDKFGITPRGMMLTESARPTPTQVFLGVALTSGARDEVIPFFERGLPVEYELARSIRIVTQAERKKIGVVTTAAKIFGGFDMQTMNSDPPWPIVTELQKQYEVTQLSAESPILDNLDGLLVPLPSALSQEEMNNLAAYIRAGNPTLLLDDPLPTFNLRLSPMEEPGAGQNPFMRNQQPPETPKGNIAGLLSQFGVRYNPADVIWHGYNPHPNFATLPQEIAFFGGHTTEGSSFSDSSRVSSGLQEIALIYAGHVEPTEDTAFVFEPLIMSRSQAGIHNWHQLVQRSFFGVNINRNPRRFAGETPLTLAASVRGKLPGVVTATDTAGEVSAATAERPVRLIMIPDLDFISDQFFQIRNLGVENLTFDNIAFFLNCMDDLVNDSSFIDLRKKRVRHRTLTSVEERTRQYHDQRVLEEQKAEEDAGKALADAQSRLNEKVKKVSDRVDLDQQTKQIMAQNLQEAENRRFEALKQSIEEEKNQQIERSKETMEGGIRAIESGIKTLAVALPPIPALIFGAMTFLRRRKREHEGTAAERRLRS